MTPNRFSPRHVGVLVLCATGACSSHGAHAAFEINPRLALQWANAQTTESVYFPNGAKLSELEWNLDRVLRLDLGVTVQPVDWVRVNIDYALPIEDGDADMTDYDWMVQNLDWTHQSVHDDTVIKKANQFDIDAEFAVYTIGSVLLTGGIGYRIDDWEWDARGGTFTYSIDGFRDTSGSFPDGENGITYAYKYSSFYVSLGAEADLKNFVLGARVLYGPETKTETKDTHHMRGLTFEEDFDDTTMLSFELRGAWRFNERLSLFGDYSYTHYDEVKGKTTVSDTLTGESFTGGATKGAIESKSSVFSLGVSYRFF
jgi:plasminogen activator